MTTVYGVTFVGAREQIAKQLKDRGDIEAHEIWACSSYLAKVVMASIGDLFSGAKAIQNWLTVAARLIAKSIPRERIETAREEYDQKLKRQLKKAGRKDIPEGQIARALPFSRLPKEQMTSVVWTTPLGLPIVQPYRKTKRKQVMTSIQTVFISDPNAPSEVNTTKQASAFPPNFVHSLDATHMMLTALECNKLGLTFASVHDSYWTHAGTINEMNKIIRDTFIALHESDVLQRLRDEFIDRYRDYQIPLVCLRSPSILKQMQKSASQLLQLGVGVGEKSPCEKAAEENAKELLSQVQTEVDDAAEVAEASSEELDESVEATIGAEPSIPEGHEPIDTSINSNDLPGEICEAGAIRTRTSDEEPQQRQKRTKEEIETAKAEKAKRRTEREQLKLQKKQEELANMAKGPGGKHQDVQVNRFVNLADVIPPIPKKGEFDVKTIKDSMYFFS